MVFFRTIKKEGEPVQTKGEVEKEGKVSLNKMKATERSTIGLPRGGRPARSCDVVHSSLHTFRRARDKTARAIRLGFVYRTDAHRAPSET